MRWAIIRDVKIVVVDSDRVIREFVKDVLAYSVNREVFAFESVVDARGHMEADTADVVLCNVEMPLDEGFDLISGIKREDPDRVCIAVSGNPSHDKRARELAADGFLAKPFGVSDLFDLVQKFVVGPLCEPV